MTVSRRSAIKTIGVVTAGSAVSGTALAIQEDDEELDIEEETDEDDIGSIRFAHFSPDAPAVDVYVDDQLILENLDYNEVTAYLEIEPATYEVTITAADDPDTVVFEQQVPVDAAYYTAAAVGELGDEVDVEEPDEELDDPDPELEEEPVDEEPVDEEPVDEFEVLLLVDQTPDEVQEDTAEVRLVHASPNAPPVDVIEGETGATVAEEVPFAQPTGYVPREPTEITFEVFPADEAEEPVDEEDDPDDEELEPLAEDELISTEEPLVSESVELEEGLPYTVFAIGYLDDDTMDEETAPEIDPEPEPEDDRPFELTVVVDGTDDEEVEEEVDADDEVDPVEEPEDEEPLEEEPDDDLEDDDDVLEEPDDEEPLEEVPTNDY